MRLFISLFIILSFSVHIFAQEQQVAFDSEGRFMEISQDLEKKINFFSQEYPGFQRAMVFRQADGSYLIEVEYMQDGARYRDRKEFTESEFADFQAEITLAIYSRAQEETMDQSGRVAYITSSIVHSLAFYGPSLLTNLDVDGRGAVATYMLVGASGFVIPFTVTKNIDVTPQAAAFKVYGQSRGMLHGLFLLIAINPDISGEGTFLGASIFSMLEAPLAFALVNQQDWSMGHVATMSMMGDFGFGYGLALSDYVNAYERETPGLFSALTFSSSIGGLFLGDRLNQSGIYSTGDAFNSRGMGLLGAFTGLTLTSYFEPGPTEWLTSMLLLGNGAGLYMGHKMAETYDFDAGEGLLINLGTLAGGLTGLGMAYLVLPENSRVRGYLTGTTVGAFGGLLLMHRIYTERFERRRNREQDGVSFNYEINPLPIIQGSSLRSGEVTGRNAFNASNYQPAFRLSLRF